MLYFRTYNTPELSTFIFKAAALYIKFSFLTCYLRSFFVSPEHETCLIVITPMSGDKHPNRSSLTASEQRCQHIWPKGPPIESIPTSRGSDWSFRKPHLSLLYCLSLWSSPTMGAFENVERWSLGKELLKVSKWNDTDALKPVLEQFLTHSSKDGQK